MADNSEKLRSGILLVAAAHMADPNFGHSVVLICDHQDQGTFGLILNQPVTNLSLKEILPAATWDCPVYRGGPVEENSLHFIHSRPDIDIGGKEVIPGVFWAGDFERLADLIMTGVVAPEECRFFVGYSGWGSGQLREELLIDSWYIRKARPELVFEQDWKNHWRNVLGSMGPDYKILSNFPDDPRLN